MVQTFTIETYGCAVNKADSEYMAGLLEEAGLISCKDGDVLIVNTCTVKTPTERKILKRLQGLEKEKRKVVVAGCLPSAQPDVADLLKSFSFIGTNIKDVVEAVEVTVRGERFVKIADGECSIDYPKKRMNNLIEIIPVASGCVGECSYCITRKARGVLKSNPIDKILGRVEKAVSGGAREIWLTSQDNGAYGLDSGETLPELLNEVCRVDGEFKIRVGMMNPDHVVDMLDALIESFRREKIYGFLHIPVQSGDDRVLRDMNRNYSVKDFIGVVSRFRKNIPRITLSTDVILGFPSEDDDAFRNTVELVEKIKPEVLNISRFWLRPGTAAGEFRQLPTRITKDRSRIIDGIFRDYALEKNREWIGWEGRVLVTEKGRGDSFVGRNFAYKPVILNSDDNILGGFVDVKIIDATFIDLRGEVLDNGLS